MKRISTIRALGLLSACVPAIAPVKSSGAEGKPIVVYMQMGGDKGTASGIGPHHRCRSRGQGPWHRTA